MPKKTNFIIVSTVFLFFLSGLFLAYTESKQMDPSNSNLWWTAYFANPKTDSLSFVIENHSASGTFHWELVSENTLLSQGNENIKNNQSKNITVSYTAEQNKKTSLVITSGKDRKEIYKNF